MRQITGEGRVMHQEPERRILFLNACVRRDSRTLALAKTVLSHLSGTVTEVNLEQEALRPLTAQTLAQREDILMREDWDAPMLRHARAFAAADEIVLAAPYWDLSFPAAVKTYLEHVTVVGVTFSYGPDGIPVGHCRGRRLFYVMTAGGPILPPNHGFAYVRDVATGFYGIGETVLFQAQGLDADGADVPSILHEAQSQIEDYFTRRHP